MDEYTVLVVFLSGMLTQALFATRSRRGRAGVLVLAATAGGIAWAAMGRGPGWRFDVPVLAGLLFLLGFACFFRDLLLPRISVRALLHLTLPVYYLLVAERSRLALPPALVAASCIPLAWLIWLAVRRPAPGRTQRLLMYLWYLVIMIWLVPCQWGGDWLPSLFRQTGFTPQLLAVSFAAGSVALYFATHVLCVLMLIPMPRRRSLIERLLEGPRDPADDFVRDHARGLIDKVEPARARGPIAGLLLALHAALLLADLAWHVAGQALAVNGSILLVNWLLLAPPRADVGAAGDRARSPAPEPMLNREAS
jgi:hypothetical protein